MNKELLISELMIARFECEYPSLNVRQEIQHMQAWWEANPRKRKQPKGEYRFVIGWLNKSYAQVVTAEVKSRIRDRDAVAGSFREPPAGHVAECERNIAEILKAHPELA